MTSEKSGIDVSLRTLLSVGSQIHSNIASNLETMIPENNPQNKEGGLRYTPNQKRVIDTKRLKGVKVGILAKSCL